MKKPAWNRYRVNTRHDAIVEAVSILRKEGGDFREVCRQVLETGKYIDFPNMTEKQFQQFIDSVDSLYYWN